MKRDFNNNSSDKLRLTVTGAMRGVERQVAALAPNPDRPDHRGLLFVKTDSRGTAPGSHDGLMGSLLLDCLTGGLLSQAFSEALHMPAAAQGMDWGTVADITDEIWTDRRSSNENFELGERGTMTRAFNRRMSDPFADRLRAAWISDLPERQRLEARYAALSRTLDAAGQEKLLPQAQNRFAR